ncbi:hypothetical protein [Aquicoccus sp.]|uniref:hypothetical protein n=1 Tax=Aquicoccus sp. TaxID=2055851 RepID=UPI003561D9AD
MTSAHHVAQVVGNMVATPKDMASASHVDTLLLHQLRPEELGVKDRLPIVERNPPMVQPTQARPLAAYQIPGGWRDFRVVACSCRGDAAGGGDTKPATRQDDTPARLSRPHRQKKHL